MYILSGLQTPACLINNSGEVLITNSLFADLFKDGPTIRNIRTHFRSDIYPDRNVPLERFADEQLGVELLIRDVEYTAELHAYREQDAAGYLVTLLKKVVARTISPALQTQMLRYSVDCIKLVRSDGTLEYMNRAGCLALGVDEGEEHFGMEWLGLLPDDVRQSGQAKLDAAINGTTGSFPGRSVSENGEIIYWDNLLMPVNDPRTGERKVICVSRNVTAEVQAKARLKNLSETDELTGLFNRRHFNATLTSYFKRTQTSGYLILADLDDFKFINDTHGHHAGDYLLRTLAERWAQAISKNILIARLGGDEFAFLCTGGGEDDASCPDSVIATIAGTSTLPVAFEGCDMNVGISMGYVLIPAYAKSEDEALASADKALRQAKSSGKGKCLPYLPPSIKTLITQ